MARITSHHESPLPIPGGPIVHPGRSVFVKRWHVVKRMAMVQAWLTAGAISAVESDAEIMAAEDAERESLLRTLTAAGAKTSTRWGLKRLRAEAKEIGLV
jgi:hypothetical protein|tara:strand:- start:913 stop:1212 length:300 start_codon:yes stop_codon:yes gene_type:complete